MPQTTTENKGGNSHMRGPLLFVSIVLGVILLIALWLSLGMNDLPPQNTQTETLKIN